MEISWLSIVPVLLAIILSFVVKNVFIALLSGIIVAGIILDFNTGRIFTGLDSIYQVFQDDWAAKSILFCLMIGAFVYVIEASGGVHGMVEYLTEKRKVVKSKMGGQVSAGVIDVDPMSVVISVIPFQLYGIFSILLVALVILMDKHRKREGQWGKVNKENVQPEENSPEEIFEGVITPKVKNMIVPLVLLVGSIFGIMCITGNGNILKGDGSAGIYVGAIVTLIVTGIYYISQGITNTETYMKWVVKGMGNYLGVTMILVLAFAFSNLVGKLGTGAFIASISSSVNPAFVPLMIFIVGAMMSFATGTSGGTVAVLIPIAVVGGTGQVGYPLTEELLKLGAEVVVVSRRKHDRNKEKLENLKTQGAELQFCGEYNNVENLTEIFEEVDVVVVTTQLNVGITEKIEVKIMEAAEKAGVKRFVPCEEVLEKLADSEYLDILLLRTS